MRKGVLIQISFIWGFWESEGTQLKAGVGKFGQHLSLQLER